MSPCLWLDGSLRGKWDWLFINLAEPWRAAKVFNDKGSVSHQSVKAAREKTGRKTLGKTLAADLWFFVL